MVPIVDQMIERSLFVSDYLRDHPHLAQWRTSNNAALAFTDAEVITMGLMQGGLGVDTLKKTYSLIAATFREWFPRWIAYQQWLARLHALSEGIGRLVWASVQITGQALRVYVFDSKPIPVCQPIRQGRVRLLREDGAYFGKTKAGWFFGFKLHAVIHISGVVLDAVLTPGNWADGKLALRLCEAIDGGIGLGDTSYGGQPVQAELAEEADLLVITPGAAGKRRKTLISCLRERIETVFSALWSLFVDRVFSRSWHGLWNTIKLKVLQYNLCHQGIVSQ
ncbi:MAG: IS982 family transposase [Armatimonadetes bacterium]|nr:IS982 family transposase [Armatimonadota bacterium]